MACVDPVIVIPGVAASTLHDEYPVDHQVVWDLALRRAPDRVMPHPEDRRYEARLPARVRAREVFAPAYRELVDELRRDLPAHPDAPVPVYAFAYDWRRPLAATERELADFVEEVVDRTRLMRSYAQGGWAERPGVSLVGHSMGGLVVTGFLSGRWTGRRVRRVATIATPFRGSVEAVARLTLGARAPSERESARLTPSLYHLLPSFPGGLRTPPDVESSIFDARVWQASVKESIAEALRLYGANPPGPDDARIAEAGRILQAMLDEARTHREMVERFDPARHGLSQNDWLAFVGVGEATWARASIVRAESGYAFALDRKDVVDDWDGERSPGGLTGDGVVPLASAEPPFAEGIRVVRLSRGDFEPFEIKDKLLLAAADLHGVLPNMNALQRSLVRFLRGAPAEARRYSSNV